MSSAAFHPSPLSRSRNNLDVTSAEGMAKSEGAEISPEGLVVCYAVELDIPEQTQCYVEGWKHC